MKKYPGLALATAASITSMFICNVLYAQEQPDFSSGLAAELNSGLIDCGKGSRPSAVGLAVTENGKEWVVPAQTQFDSAAKATDLYNECAGTEPSGIDDVDLDSVPVIDAGGDELFTAFIFADNYFEFYANGVLIAVDAVPFTPFNSSVLKFKASKPVSIAVVGVDWEENLGLGSEAGRGKPFQPGDAGVVALIQNAAGDVVSITDSSWKAQTFYTSPIDDLACLVINGNVRDSSSCGVEGANSAAGLSAAFWPMPQGWEQAEFDDSDWPNAHVFTNDVVGVDNKPAYTNFTDLFDKKGADAQFIWSSNLVLDNLVLMRGTIE